MKRFCLGIVMVMEFSLLGTGNLFAKEAVHEEQPLANAAHNATSAQQNANTVLQATTTQGVAELSGEDTASEGDKGVPDADDDL